MGATITTAQVAAANGITYLVDDLGFPCEPCPRCAGHGELIAFHHNHGGICFHCNGSGIQYPKGKAGALATEARAALRPAPIAPADVTRGMTIRHARRHGDPAPWRTVADHTIERTPWPGGAVVDVHVITYTDGSSDRMTCENLESQPDIDRLDAELTARVAEARASHERLLTRRAAA